MFDKYIPCLSLLFNDLESWHCRCIYTKQERTTNKELYMNRQDLIRFYMVSTWQEFLEQMENCLEMPIDENNWKDHFAEFQRCFTSWYNQ